MNLLSRMRGFFTTQPTKKTTRQMEQQKTKRKLDHKIDLSNEDHCDPCGQYAGSMQSQSKKMEIPLSQTKNDASAET
jgi:hypothetical protein